MPTPSNRLPDMSRTDNTVGIAFVLARSYEPETVQMFEVICPLQDEPTNVPESLYHRGNFRPSDLLNWAYECHLAEATPFEAPGLWRYLFEQTGLNGFEMISLRPIITECLLAEEHFANARPEELLDLLPVLPRAA